MSDTKMMAKVAEHAPAQYDYLLKTAEAIKQSPFRDEIVSDMNSIIKKASMIDAAKGAWGAAPTGAKWIAGLMGASVAANLGADLYDRAKRGLTKTMHYSDMLDAHPDLKQGDKQQREQVKRHFSTLHQFNPEYASNPDVAAAYVKQSLGLEGADLSTINSLVQARKNIQEGKPLRAFNLQPMKMGDFA